ncbi:restriction system protein [Oceanobacillus limi]|uniref:Restriction system protein n=1 Tax=Oceanobacillus limi TaxID=930131 RepID=A0A1H9XZV0_9BACI|nr:restriction endonuclease [Oceanobacillus limi]SES61978.1 restriction system protein [Oceanobacillus limi]
MIYIEIAISIYLLGSYMHFIINKRKNQYKTALLSGHIDSSEELKRTLAMGLYLRFREEKDEYYPNIGENSTFIKDDPYLFEDFVADVFKTSKGGDTWVSPRSGDFGVDFEHNTENGTFLGQVKCKKNDMDYEPIAILHSNIIKNGAAGGYVITTSSYTKAAREYADGLDIELIDGIKLVDLWLED